MDKESQLRLLRKAFSDISRGYSVVFFKGRKLFIKHLSHHEQVDLDVLYRTFLEEGKKEGLPTNEYMLKYLEDESIWTKKDEQSLEDIKRLIERLIEGKKIIYLKSDLERQNKQIEEENNKYLQFKAKKDKLLGLTAEAYADKKVNEFYIVESFFVDGAFSQKWLKDDEYDNLTERQMHEIVSMYNQEMETVSDRNIKCLALQEFFQVYWSLSAENLFDFFGKPICDLTYFQVKLGSYGRTFRSILEKAESIPEDIRSDPDKLLDYVRTGQNAKERMEKAAQGSPQDGEGAVASTLFGAKEDDLKSVGIHSDPGTTSLSAELKKKQSEGKKGLNMHELMKIMGV